MLTFIQANELCRKLVPIGDAIWRFSDQLRAEGCIAFDAHNDFVESFGTGDEIHAAHAAAISLTDMVYGRIEIRTLRNFLEAVIQGIVVTIGCRFAPIRPSIEIDANQVWAACVIRYASPVMPFCGL
jgi:hypothetical protein